VRKLSSAIERLARLLKSPPKSRRNKIEELILLKKRGKVLPDERLEPSKVLMQRCELLYRLEPLIFSGVNKITRRITGTRMFFANGDEDEIRKVEEFFEESGLKSLLPHLVKDAFIYGFGVAEIVRKGKKIVSFNQINPKNFDYLRTSDQKIAFTPKGTIKGFVWKKESGEEVELAPEDVLLIRFYALGEYCLGISPLEAAFKTAWIKLNLEEALGEAMFRHGYPLYVCKVGTPEHRVWSEVTPEQIKAAKEILGDVDSATELVIPWWMDIKKIEAGSASSMKDLLEFLSSEILASLELPKAFGVQTTGLGGRAVEEMDFEKTIIVMQEELKRQLEEQVFFPYYKANKFKTKPRLQFTEYAPELQTARLRRLSTFAKYGLLSRSLEVENEIRRMEGLPLKKSLQASNQCIFGLGECPVRSEENLSLEKLAAFCNICIKRIEKESKLRGKKLGKR